MCKHNIVLLTDLLPCGLVYTIKLRLRAGPALLDTEPMTRVEPHLLDTDQ